MRTASVARFQRSLWLRLEIQALAIRVDYFEPRTESLSRFGENRFSFNWHHKPFGVLEQKRDVLWPGIFRVVTFQNKNGTCGGQFSFCELVTSCECLKVCWDSVRDFGKHCDVCLGAPWRPLSRVSPTRNLSFLRIWVVAAASTAAATSSSSSSSTATTTTNYSTTSAGSLSLAD